VIINNTLVYGAARGGHVRELAFNQQAGGFLTGDLSIRAGHLFDGLEITDMAYSKAPQPIVWFISSSGKLVGLTYVPEQQVGAWHQHDTDGAFETCVVIAEGHEDVLYVIVKRTIGGVTKRYVERQESRAFADQSDAFFVDCGSRYYHGGTFTRAGVTMTCTMTAHPFVTATPYVFHFSDKSFGEKPNGTSYVVTVTGANTFTIVVANAGATSGTVEQLVTTLTNLSWIEGKLVSVLADGAVMGKQTVTGGAITLFLATALGVPVGATMLYQPYIA